MAQYIVLALLALVIFGSGICRAITITVTGAWSETIDAGDLNPPFTAGADLNPTYTSAADAVSIDISGTIGNWRTDVKRVDSNWHGDFILSVQRTSGGTGTGSVSGGVAFMTVEETDSQFFTHNNISRHSTRGRTETASGKARSFGAKPLSLGITQNNLCICRIHLGRGRSTGINP